MTTSIRILTTSTLDSSPSILLVSSDGSKILINCGEGCQRSFLESNNNTGAGGLRVRSVTRVCLTHIAHDAVGGLPGMILTTADAADAALGNAVSKAKEASQQQRGNKNENRSNTTNRLDDEDQPVPGLDVFGPRGTQGFLNSLRHFMRRDKFSLKVHEGAFKEDQKSAPRAKPGRKAKKKNTNMNDGFWVQSIPTVHTLPPHFISGANMDGAPQQKRARTESEDRVTDSDTSVEVMSYVFTTPPIPGKFLPQKARELGVRAGPLYAQLKAGKSVTFVDSQGNEKTVESHQVVTQGNPGIVVAVIYCPSLLILQQLKKSDVLHKLVDGGDDQPILDVMIHVAPHNILDSLEYRSWLEQFGKPAEHIFLESSDCLSSERGKTYGDEDGSPFHSAATGAVTRSLLHKELYPAAIPHVEHLKKGPDNALLEKSDAETVDMNSIKVTSLDGSSESNVDIIRGKPLMEYILVPRSKKGLVLGTVRPNSFHGFLRNEWDAINKTTQESGAIDLVEKALQQIEDSESGQQSEELGGELIFTGTGSAIPCKHRNVTGMYVRMKNGNALLLDAGEGTTGQLLRTKQRDESDENFGELLRNIKAVWISHPHADHHLGILRFLTERNAICGRGVDPIILIAPVNMFRFLSEYSHVDPRIKDSYISLDCQDLVPPKKNPLKDKLENELGITSCVAIPVAHCRNSFAVVLDGTAFGRLAYSGDCRPSQRFADIAANTDLLIHEATFENGMEDEATLKRHCTVGEALEVGRRMRAKAIVLTHFSQRYPRIPPLNEDEYFNSAISNGANDTSVPEPVDRFPIVFAFDFMKLTPNNITTASKLTPALRLLYPDESEDSSLPQGPSAKEILNVPGVFAKTELL